MSTRNNRRYVIEVFLPDVQTSQHYTFEEKDVVTVGRAYGSDIVLRDDFVSLEHMQIRQDAEGFCVRDISSLNGTIVHKKRIKNEDAFLKSGQECQLGRTRLRVYSADHALEDPLTLNWGTKLQPLLNNMFVAIFLFMAVIIAGVFYGWLISDPDKYLEEDIYGSLFMTGGVFSVVLFACSINAHTHRKRVFSPLRVSIAAIIFLVVSSIVLFVVPYLHFYVPDMFTKRMLDCILIIPGTIMIGMFCCYINEGRLRLKTIIQFFFLSLILAFFSGRLPTDYDPVPRYSSILVAADMPVPNLLSIDEFLTHSQGVFNKDR